MRAIALVLIVLGAMLTAACNWLSLEPNVERPLECGTTEAGEAYSRADSAYVPATKVYICRETPLGWETSYCWFEQEADMPLEHLQQTCETFRGWTRNGGPTNLSSVS